MNALVMRLWKRLYPVLVENLGLKLFSLGAAIIVFAYVRGLDDAQRFVYVDVIALQPTDESGFVLVSEVPDRVRLTLRGSSSALNSLNRDDVAPAQIQVDPNRRNYYFDPKDFELPAGVVVEQIAPASFPLTWMPRKERTVPVRVRLVRAPEEGLELVGKPQLDPVAIVVRGPADEIDSLPSVVTEEIDLSRFAAGRHTLRVRLEDPVAHVGYEWEGPVTVTFEVGVELIEKRFVGLPIATLGGGNVTELRPRRALVVLKGPPSIIHGVDADVLVPSVDTSRAVAGTSSLPVTVRGVPAGASLVRVEPAEILVTVGAARPGTRPAPRVAPPR
jgi:hypothetical protein